MISTFNGVGCSFKVFQTLSFITLCKWGKVIVQQYIKNIFSTAKVLLLNKGIDSIPSLTFPEHIENKSKNKSYYLEQKTSKVLANRKRLGFAACSNSLGTSMEDVKIIIKSTIREVQFKCVVIETYLVQQKR